MVSCSGPGMTGVRAEGGGQASYWRARKRKRRRKRRKKKKEKKKEKKKTPPVDWATGHAQCDGRFRVRVPLAAFCERPQGPARVASGERPNAAWARRIGRGAVGRQRSAACPSYRAVVRRVHFVSCTLGKPRFPEAGPGPPRPGRRLEGRMLTRPRLGRCSPAHSAPELMVLVGAGAVHFERAVRPRLRGLHLF